MRAGYDDNWYPGCDDSSEENEPDVDECNTLNYDDFLYPNECSPSNQAQCEEYDDDESNFGRCYFDFLCVAPTPPSKGYYATAIADFHHTQIFYHLLRSL